VLVTGGSGYFGSTVVEGALARGDDVRIFDLNPPSEHSGPVTYVQGDVRDRAALRAACEGVDVLLDNVAQVPLAKDPELLRSVNVTGTANMLLCARDAGIAKVVHTSSTAVFGIPVSNPMVEDTPCRPLEPYGKAKLEAEWLCEDAIASGLDVTMIRPRTILGHGRLGIIAALFEFVAEGAPVYVLGGGRNVYQFVHAHDLAEACLLASEREKPAVYNIGSSVYGTMRELLQALIDHVGSPSTIRSLPLVPARTAISVLSQAGLAPFAKYHWLVYGEDVWFDSTKAHTELGWQPKYSDVAALIESYDWFLDNRAKLAEIHGSHHQSPVKLGLLKVLKKLP
jgi:nucleoside-diphosphate-sugar epimerase